MESGDKDKANPPSQENHEGADFGQNFQTYKVYSILCLLLKSEAIFTFFVYWLKSLEMNTGTVGLPNHNTLSHLWLLKPFFSLIIDKLNIPISQTNEDLEKHQKVPKIVQYRSLNVYSLLGITNYRVVVLLLAEFILAFCSVTLYFLYFINYFHTIFTKILVYMLALSLVCASSYSEGLFCRFVRTKHPNSYVKHVSLRLILSSIYGLTTILFLVLPVIFEGKSVGKLLQINFLFPVFLVFNAVFVALMSSKHFFPSQLQTTQDRWPLTPTASPVQMTSGSEAPVNDLFTDVMLSLMSLLTICMRLKNDFYNKYNHTVSGDYLYILSSQFFKILTSCIIYFFLGPKAVRRISMGIFAICLILAYPLNWLASYFYHEMANFDLGQILLVGFLLSSIQQFLLTYALLLALFIAVKGYEASTLSLPTFAAHLTHMCLRDHTTSFLGSPKSYDLILETFSFMFFIYCLKVLFYRGNVPFLEKSDETTPNKDSQNNSKDHQFVLSKNLYTTQYPGDSKIPWEQRSESSYDSEVL